MKLSNGFARLLPVIALTGLSCFAQAAPERPKRPRMEVRVLEARPRPAPQPAEGESYELDRNAAVLRLRSRCRDGIYREWTIELPDLLVEPALRAAVTAGPPGTFRFDYEVSNGPKARQSILGFVMDVEGTVAAGRPSGSSPGWRGDVSGPWPEKMQASWVTLGRVAVIRPGASLGGFALESRYLPGLRQMCFISGDSGVKVPPDFHLASEWAHGVFEELSGKRVCLPAVAPKLRPEGTRAQLLEAIRREFILAVSKEEFASIRAELEKFAAALGGARAPAALPAGRNTYQKDFLAAMALNLAAAQSRPE